MVNSRFPLYDFNADVLLITHCWQLLGTQDTRLPQLAFHSVHGQNVVLLNGGRVARRKESFCKGLAFSNRPISINENVCIRLTEVSTSWSGVLRFGVTNVDPESYRNVQVPKFACPDLTSKEGFWAKALPERYSVEGNILHFYITHSGDLYYGVNGVHKGVFLIGINVSLPIWIIVDIYGNSVAVEFVDPSDFHVPRSSSTTPCTTTACNPRHEPTSVEPPVTLHQELQVTSASCERTSSSGFECLRFHQVTGRHISLNAMRNIATRCDSEYSQGYVFSERPIRNNEKVVIEVVTVQKLYIGGLAFGVTCCDPSTLRPVDLPDNSSDLVEMPQYWVGIKDIALQPPVNTVLSFWITDAGEVKFEKDQNVARTVLHVDNSLPLYMFFDVYGSTQAIKLRGKMFSVSIFNRASERILRYTLDHIFADLPALPRPPPVAPRVVCFSTRLVCMWAKVNSALYKCGHSCMCYDCAMQTYRSSGLCPLCRASIVDVLKIFKA
ncbi:unnamed protein product [Angiostrongylus costaricensis]|uniref:Neuralized E3 ubiquitin protein ligase 1B n=1 Tax=Angiostrongylus costaricensis TaxID=334426 RepID=A0A158PDH2_ANGCS|nr:unnamed protein product [Angiostrongylus costaricensis]